MISNLFFAGGSLKPNAPIPASPIRTPRIWRGHKWLWNIELL
jgi:hypothetical protein